MVKVGRRDVNESTLWRISAYEHLRAETGNSGFATLGQRSLLSTSLNAELSRMRNQGQSDDVLVVLSACLRNRENALLLLQHQGMVWPLSLLPRQDLYHLPRPILGTLGGGRRDLAGGPDGEGRRSSDAQPRSAHRPARHAGAALARHLRECAGARVG